MEQRVDTVYASYFDSIDDRKVQIIMQSCMDLIARFNPETLYFLISSPGGGVNAGITLHNFLRALPTKVVMHNTGIVDSIANVIFLAGEERYATESSTFLFHGVQWTTKEATSTALPQLREILSQLTNDERRIASILSRRSNLLVEEIEAMHAQGSSKDASFAFEKGIIHRIKDPMVPRGAPFLNIRVG